MALKSLKKTLVYSGESSRDLIESMIEDQAIFSKSNGSTIMEDYILKGLLTENTTIANWISSMYTLHWSTGKIISAVFEYNSAGVNWGTKGLQLLPIIEFAIREQDFARKCKVDEKDMFYVFDQLNSIKAKFSGLEKESLDLESKAKFKEAQNYVKRLIEKSKSNYASVPFVDYYKLIKLYWVELCNWTIPFRMLSCISEMQTGWRDDVESRCELVELLKALAKSWPID